MALWGNPGLLLSGVVIVGLGVWLGLALHYHRPLIPTLLRLFGGRTGRALAALLPKKR
jgi:hypothetical protein